jgi:hypothetical protein
MHNTALDVTDTTTPELGRLFIRTNFKLNYFKERQCTTRVEIYKYNTIFYNIFKIKKSNVMVNVTTPDDGNMVPIHVVEK